MNDLALYMHSGSGNHGCEAIVDSLVRLLNENDDQTRMTLVSYSKQEDETYLPQEVRLHLDIAEEGHIEVSFLRHALYYGIRKVTGDDELFLRYRLAPIAAQQVRKAPEAMAAGELPKVAVSIGGDNYCYDSMMIDVMRANRMLNHQGTRTILLGCSIEPDRVQGNQAMLDDMNLYTRILARESITYKALVDAGIDKSKVLLVPDPAFTLPANEDSLPEGFETGNMVGINLSPMALDYAADKEAVLNGYAALIQVILDKTMMKVALIPHVVWSRSDDRVPLQRLYDRFKDTGRVLLVQDMCAERLKGVIANCRFFIGARTHSTIAAYSTLVPTLVIGYSVKARGIARDLFGQEEHFVLPVQTLTHPEDLIHEFEWLYHNEDEIRYDLTGAIPMYMNRARQNADVIRDVLRGTMSAQMHY